MSWPLALADQHDVVSDTFEAADLLDLLDVAHTQVSEIRDDEEAEGYGLTYERAQHLTAVVERLIAQVKG